jgi:serine acetyltransferase/glycosyltransferase involved in cell wall biosynthesis
LHPQVAPPDTFRDAVSARREAALNPLTVLILSYSFHPSNDIGARRTTALAQYLADQGIRAVVVSAFGGKALEAGSQPYPGVIAVPVKHPRRRLLDLLIRLKRATGSQSNAPPHGDGASPAAAEASLAAMRLRATLREWYFRVIYFIDQHKRWSWRAAAAAIRAGKEQRASLLIVSAPPHSTLLAAAWAARRLRIPYVTDLRDAWCDELAIVYPRRRLELRLLRSLERSVLKHAAAVTTTSASVAALLSDRYVDPTNKVHVIRNGYDGGVAPGLVHTGGQLSILFAGELYVHRTPYPFLAALESLLERPGIDPGRVRVTFMGTRAGAFSDQSLNEWMRGKRCAAVVRLLPPQSADAVAREVAHATVLLNLAQEQRLHVPAKTFEHLASGRELLLICESDCETAQVVSGIAGIIQIDQRDTAGLISALADLYRRHVVEGVASVPAPHDVSRFSRAPSNERFHALLTSLAASCPESGPEPDTCLAQPPSTAGVADAGADRAQSASAVRYPFARQLLADARFYHHLTRPSTGGRAALAWTILRNRGLWLLTFHRIGHYCLRRRQVRSPVWWLARVYKGFGSSFSVLFCRSELSEDCEIEGPAYLSNQGYLLCGARSIGSGSLIHDRCTFGYTVADGGEGRPVIGRNVWIGSNCIIAGSLTVGDGATVLPGTFLTFSVPPRAVVQGNPAMVTHRDFDNAPLRRSLTVVKDLATITSDGGLRRRPAPLC